MPAGVITPGWARWAGRAAAAATGSRPTAVAQTTRYPDDGDPGRTWQLNRSWPPRSPPVPDGAAAILAETGDPTVRATARALVKPPLAPREKLSGAHRPHELTGRTALTAAGGVADGLGLPTRQPCRRRPIHNTDHETPQTDRHPSPVVDLRSDLLQLHAVITTANAGIRFRHRRANIRCGVPISRLTSAGGPSSMVGAAHAALMNHGPSTSSLAARLSNQPNYTLPGPTPTASRTDDGRGHRTKLDSNVLPDERSDRPCGAAAMARPSDYGGDDTVVWAAEFSHRVVRVNAIAPGPVRTIGAPLPTASRLSALRPCWPAAHPGEIATVSASPPRPNPSLSPAQSSPLHGGRTPSYRGRSGTHRILVRHFVAGALVRPRQGDRTPA